MSNLVRVARVIRGISQQELAEAADLTPSRLCKIEHGIVVPRPEEILRLWTALTESPPAGDAVAADQGDRERPESGLLE